MDTFFSFLKTLSWSATFAVMFGGALRLGPSSLRLVLERPWLSLRTLLAVWVAVPAVTMLVVVGLRIEGVGAATLLLMAGCPGIPLLLGTTRKVQGAMRTAFVALVLTAATEPLLIPYWTRIVSGVLPVDLAVQPRHILQVLVPTIFLPIALAFALRLLAAQAVDTLARISDWVYAVGVIGCGTAILIEAAPVLLQVPPRTFLGAMIITLLDAVIGYWAGWPDQDDQKAVALAASLGNPALALAVAEASYPEHRAGPLVAGYLLVRAVAIAPFEWWMKRTRGQATPRRRVSAR